MDPTRATSPTGSQGSNETPDLPHSMLFVPKFTKAREPRPLNRDGTPVNPELNREPSPADEAAWKRIDADLRRAWDASDWTAFDDACRRAFARLAGD